MRWLSVLFVATLVGCCSCPPTELFTVNLSPERAERGEVVTVTLSGGVSAEGARVLVENTNVAITVESDNTFTFEVPDSAPSGKAEITVITRGEQEGSGTLGVFGRNVIEDEIVVVLEPLENFDDLEEFLEERGFSFAGEEAETTDLGGDFEPCSGTLVIIDIGDTPLGQALEELKQLEAEGIARVLGTDGVSAQGTGTINHVLTMQTVSVQRNESLGTGTTIAVLDTGVNNFSNDIDEFSDRLLTGYNALDGSTNTADASSDHGTDVATIAAGNTAGIAQGALVLPVKVCDEEGNCLASDVIEGLCWALGDEPENANAGRDIDPSRMVINLSLGGDNDTTIINALLDAAVEQGVLVAAAGGNEGLNGSPRHYPAAHDLDGLMAVAAVEPSVTETCVTFEDLPLGEIYSVGDNFASDNVKIGVLPFTFSNGNTFDGGSVSVTNDFFDSTSLFTGNTNLNFSSGLQLEQLTAKVGWFGGNLNLTVNEELANVNSLSELDGLSVGGVAVAVAPAGEGESLLELTGDIVTFSIGGQEFALDDLCLSENAETVWTPADYSTRGDYLDIAAPGQPLTGADSNGLQGTSYAAPFVAGTMAAVRGEYGGLTPAEVQQCLEASATQLPFAQDAVGAGLLDTAGALETCAP